MANTKTKIGLIVIASFMSSLLITSQAYRGGGVLTSSVSEANSQVAFAANAPPSISSPFGSGSSSSSSSSGASSPPSLEPMDSGTGTDTTKDTGSTLKKDTGSSSTTKDSGTSTKTSTKDLTSYVQPPSSTAKSTSKAKVAKTGPEIAYLILPSLMAGWFYRKRKK